MFLLLPNQFMTWAKIIGDKAMEIVSDYERKHQRSPEYVHKRGVGYDIHSFGSGERFIEVKGVSEHWKTYTWQNLHHTEVRCLKNNPDKFFLYIVHFEILPKDRNENVIKKAPYDIYIISGRVLLSNKFNLKEQSYSLTPISKTKLLSYRVNL